VRTLATPLDGFLAQRTVFRASLGRPRCIGRTDDRRGKTLAKLIR
jgi:hypothetical protein